jgi:purine-binding chemotaxis protein CheW
MSAAAALAGKYLTVVLDCEAYGIAVRTVREIIRLPRITTVPRMPAHLKGVINLRGRVIPVTDLRLRFGLAAALTARTCIVVVQVSSGAGGPVQAGLIVDAVEEVANLADADIEPTPDLGTRIDGSCLLGFARVKGVVKMLLDIERVLAPDYRRAA